MHMAAVHFNFIIKFCQTSHFYINICWASMMLQFVCLRFYDLCMCFFFKCVFVFVMQQFMCLCFYDLCLHIFEIVFVFVMQQFVCLCNYKVQSNV